MPSTDAGREQHRHRSVLGLSLAANSESRARSWTCPTTTLKPARTWDHGRHPGAADPGADRLVRVARPRLLDHRRDGAGGAARHVQSVHRWTIPTGMTPPTGAWRRPASRPCTCCRPSTSPRSRRSQSQRVEPDIPEDAGPASTEQQEAVMEVADSRRLQLGLRPVPLHHTGGFVLDGPRRVSPASSSTARWCSR